MRSHHRVSIGLALVAAASMGVAETTVHRPVISPDGERIVFMMQSEETGGDWELFAMRLDGRDQQRLTHHVGWDGYAVWSPSGDALVFDRGVDNDSKRPHRIDLDSLEVAAFGPVREGWLAVNDWNASGLLAFWERDGQRDLFLLNEDGSSQRQLTDTPRVSEHDAHFSPDGRLAAFASGASSGEGRTRLETLDLQHGNRRTRHESAGRIYGIDWSPDGTRIAFTDAPGGGDDDADVFVLELATGTIDPVTDDPAWDHMPEWTADGEALLFTSYRDGTEALYLVRPPGPPMRLWVGPR